MKIGNTTQGVEKENGDYADTKKLTTAASIGNDNQSNNIDDNQSNNIDDNQSKTIDDNQSKTIDDNQSKNIEFSSNTIGDDMSSGSDSGGGLFDAWFPVGGIVSSWWAGDSAKKDVGNTGKCANTGDDKDTNDDTVESTVGIGEWLFGAGKNVTEKGLKFVEDVAPEFQEFANQLGGDTKLFLQKRVAQLTTSDDDGGSGAVSERSYCGTLNVTGGTDTGGSITGGSVTGGSITGGSVTGGSVTGRVSTGGVSSRSERRLSGGSQDIGVWSGMSARFMAKYNKMKVDPSSYLIDADRRSDSGSSPRKSSQSNIESSVSPIDEAERMALAEDSIVVDMKTKLVPSKVSEQDFWKRFFLRVEMLKSEEFRLKSLMLQAAQVNADEELDWDDTKVTEAEAHMGHCDLLDGNDCV